MNSPGSRPTLPKKLLVPVDLSDTTPAVVEFAEGLADHFGAELTLLHVWELPPFAQSESLQVVAGPDKKPLSEHVRQEAAQELSKLSPSRADVTRKVVIGNAAEDIVHTATSGGFDLVVIGTHGRGGLAHIALGSVAERVLRRSPVPVLVVPTRPKRKDSPR
jgi:nucleotide-binding universal stress UspA family protein